MNCSAHSYPEHERQDDTPIEHYTERQAEDSPVDESSEPNYRNLMDVLQLNRHARRQRVFVGYVFEPERRLFESYLYENGTTVHYVNGKVIGLTVAKPYRIISALVWAKATGHRTISEPLQTLIASGFFHTTASECYQHDVQQYYQIQNERLKKAS